jgi:mgtE-like transporter
MTLFAPVFTVSPWILALFPPILTVRGGIGGLFSGNLATMLHLGLIKPKVRGNTEQYTWLIKSVLVITVIDTLILGSFSFIVNLVYGSAQLNQWFLFICIPTVACVMAVSLSIPLTSLIAIETYKRGLDPDILVYPILASMNDIIVTSFFVVTVFFVLWGGAYYSILVALFVSILAVVGYVAVQSRGNKFFQQTLQEGTFVVVMSSIFGSLNGILLSNLGPSIARTPGLMTMYPALTNSLGNVGSIIGSKTTTDIALGYARSFIEELKESGKNIIQVEIPAVAMNIVFALISFTMARGSGANLMELVSIALTTNLISFIVVSMFALWIAHLAFEKGLNPDNIVIPAITSVSDTTVTVALTPALMVTKILMG